MHVQVSVAPSAGTAAQHAEARDGAHLEQSINAGALKHIFLACSNQFMGVFSGLHPHNKHHTWLSAEREDHCAPTGQHICYYLLKAY